MKRYVVSKWKKTEALLENNELREKIPETARMTMNSLHAMLHEYQMVYIKPNIGTFGNGVMRVEWDSKATTAPYRYQLGVRAQSFLIFDDMYETIIKITKNRSYLVQKGIQLLKYQKRRFDLRVMIQKNLRNQWEATGWIGRVAHPKKIVTNYHSGGTLKSVETLLGAYLEETEKKQFIRKIKRLGTKVAQQIQQRFPGIKEIGVDLAIDNQYKPWILEVNTLPDPYIFRRLNNKAVFGKIIRYARANRKA
jgi:glutathione synthase/RimK-type ligase-like ATP-grasp enzyme